MADQRVSVLMACHAGDCPGALARAFRSLAEQTVPADEVVLVQDGPVGSEHTQVLEAWSERLPLRWFALDCNRGLGYALGYGLPRCSHQYVARVDADDTSLPDRFRKQRDYLDGHPEIAALGSWIMEVGTFRNGETFESLRALPTEPGDVARFARHRSPLNHMTVMFRRDAVLQAGNYHDLPTAQDYHLWGRMLVQGWQLANLPECLVRANVGSVGADRRGGWQRLKADIRVQRDLLQCGFLSYRDLVVNVPIRISVRLMPTVLRRRLYQVLWRPSSDKTV